MCHTGILVLNTHNWPEYPSMGCAHPQSHCTSKHHFWRNSRNPTVTAGLQHTQKCIYSQSQQPKLEIKIPPVISSPLFHSANSWPLLSHISSINNNFQDLIGHLYKPRAVKICPLSSSLTNLWHLPKHSARSMFNTTQSCGSLHFKKK